MIESNGLATWDSPETNVFCPHCGRDITLRYDSHSCPDGSTACARKTDSAFKQDEPEIEDNFDHKGNFRDFCRNGKYKRRKNANKQN